MSMKKILKSIYEPLEKIVVEMLLVTGARTSELLNIRKSDVKLDSYEALIRDGKGNVEH